MRPPARLLPVAALLALSACGTPAEADAVNVATTWLQAVRAGEETAACGLMTAGAPRAIAAAHALAPRSTSCHDVLAAFHDRLGTDGLDAALDGLHARGAVRHDRARVAGGPEVVRLRYDGRRWAVAGAEPR